MMFVTTCAEGCLPACNSHVTTLGAAAHLEIDGRFKRNSEQTKGPSGLLTR